MFSLICVWINDWVNNREAGDLRRYRAHYDVIVVVTFNASCYYVPCSSAGHCIEQYDVKISTHFQMDGIAMNSNLILSRCHLNGLDSVLLIRGANYNGQPQEYTMDLLWQKFQWILPFYMKPISFQSKASVVCSVTAAIIIDFYLKKLNMFSQHFGEKPNEYLNSAELIPGKWNVDQLFVLITSWDIT